MRFFASARALFFIVAVASCGDPTPLPKDETDGGAAGNDASSSSANGCVEDGDRVDNDEVCCAGLFKACTGQSSRGSKPCVCSTVACGTAREQPPPNVPCCQGVNSRCVGNGANTQCTCG